ncbi:MAG: hypothetical protein WDN02_12890 [Methylovirgula sp.]|uniref:hypothetical protein n=1 Tax=Methylovirgula sp. TaxID=1978224 RepID=UPI0030764A35
MRNTIAIQTDLETTNEWPLSRSRPALASADHASSSHVAYALLFDLAVGLDARAHAQRAKGDPWLIVLGARPTLRIAADTVIEVDTARRLYRIIGETDDERTLILEADLADVFAFIVLHLDLEAPEGRR